MSVAHGGGDDRALGFPWALTGAWVLALGALALPDPERWQPGARLALVALALGAGAALPGTASTGTASSGAGAAARRAFLFAAPPLALAAGLERGVVLDVEWRALLALGLIVALGGSAGCLGRSGGLDSPGDSLGDSLGDSPGGSPGGSPGDSPGHSLGAARARRQGLCASGAALGLGLAAALPLWIHVWSAHGGARVAGAWSELARFSPLAFLHGLAGVDLVADGGRAALGAALIGALAWGARR
ncbi:MAG: hypothetical protein R3F49_19550 [Planctomycetota bacterium]